MSSNKKKGNKYKWTKQRIVIAVIAGAMCLLLLLPLVSEIFVYA